PSAARFQYVQPEGPAAATCGTLGGALTRKVSATGGVLRARRSCSCFAVVMALASGAFGRRRVVWRVVRGRQAGVWWARGYGIAPGTITSPVQVIITTDWGLYTFYLEQFRLAERRTAGVSQLVKTPPAG